MSNTTPWKCGHAFQNNGPDYWLIATQLFRGHEIAKATTQANAEFIVRACNAHEELLAACEAALRRLEHYTAETETCDLGVPDERALALIRGAIAKAKNQTEPAQNL